LQSADKLGFLLFTHKGHKEKFVSFVDYFFIPSIENTKLIPKTWHEKNNAQIPQASAQN
jgi:hypothetical protein